METHANMGTETSKVKKIYVSNLPWSATDADLEDFFSAYGEVHSAKVITDRETGRSRGFGFVEMDAAAAEQAIAEGDGRELSGRPLNVKEAIERAPRQNRGGGGNRW
jgi:RNA recognition motif-containing protein